MKVYAATDIGKTRPINEDSFYIPRGEERFCAVADGMGGHNAGEVASALAVKVLSKQMAKQADKPVVDALRASILAANKKIFAAAKKNQACEGMGTTITALALEGDTVHIAQVGDSRAYLMRNKAMLRMTTDHTLVEEMVMNGLLTPGEARIHPKRNIITRALGTAETVEVDMLRLEVEQEDVYLLCSDGLSNYITEREMLEILTGSETWEEKLQALIKHALDNGGYDNITALIVTFEEAL